MENRENVHWQVSRIQTRDEQWKNRCHEAMSIQLKFVCSLVRVVSFAQGHLVRCRGQARGKKNHQVQRRTDGGETVGGSKRHTKVHILEKDGVSKKTTMSHVSRIKYKSLLGQKLRSAVVVKNVTVGDEWQNKKK